MKAMKQFRLVSLLSGRRLITGGELVDAVAYG
jgi:hypothetical protein